MSEILAYDVAQEIAVITIDSPPVNALSHAVRRAIKDGLARSLSDASVKAIILLCAGRTFFAGADISEFGRPFAQPDFSSLFGSIEASPKPVIAAIHGTALGGGLEAALRCHYRVAVATSKLGLPEVHLGVLPGSGGTQLLPRVVGVPMALEMMTGGKPVSARRALELGLLDAVWDDGDLRGHAIEFAREVVAKGAIAPRISQRDDLLASYREKPQIFADFLGNNAHLFRGLKAPQSIVEAVRAAVELPYEQGLERESALFLELMKTTESAALRYAFFAERLTSKIPDLPPGTASRPIRSVGVIGAGTMGTGITLNFLDIQLPVTLVEQTQGALDRGLSAIQKIYSSAVKKGRMTEADAEARMRLITPTQDYAALADVDLVIEAVFESLAIKLDVFKQLAGATKPDAILATNTSFLDVDTIAGATARPENVIGLHFFSPAHIMPLLEVVRGRATSPGLIETAMKLARNIGKTPVLSRVCHGFIANRMMQQRSKQADLLSLQGVPFVTIDRIMHDYGFAMGPFQMIDLVGLDVMGRDSNEKTAMGELVRLGRLGQKSGAGFYDYGEKGATIPSPIAESVIKTIAQERDIFTEVFDNSTILARLLYPVINEGAKILQEGIALRASDIDIALIKGYNWPTYRGGPMFWADTIGLEKIVAELEKFEARYGDAFKPTALLKRLADEGKRLSEQ